MGSLSPIWPVESNRVIILTKDNDLYYRYTFEKDLPTSRNFELEITNIYGNPFLWTVLGYFNDKRSVTFNYPMENANQISKGASWQIFLISEGIRRVVAQGIFVRSDAPN